MREHRKSKIANGVRHDLVVPLEAGVQQIRVVDEVRFDVLLEHVERLGVIVDPSAHRTHFLQRIGASFLIEEIDEFGDDWHRRGWRGWDIIQTLANGAGRQGIDDMWIGIMVGLCDGGLRWWGMAFVTLAGWT